MSEARTNDRWDKFLDTLGPMVRRQLSNPTPPTHETEEATSFREFAGKLPGGVRDAVSKQAEEKVWPEDIRPKPCLIVFLDGHPPVQHILETYEGMAEIMKKLDGQDAYVYPILGIPIPFTQSPNRVLLLPNNTALQLDESLVAPDLNNHPARVQNNNFMGLPELVVEATPEEERTARKKRAAPPDDDEFVDETDTEAEEE